MEPHCPADGTTLTRLEVLGRSLLSCPECGGTFLSGSDLSVLTRLSPKALKLEPSHTRSMVCPGCGERLCSAMVAGQELDACPRCSSVWLAQGALRRLMGSGAQVARVTPRTRVWLAALALTLGVGLGGLFGWTQLRASQLAQAADQAWELKNGQALRRAADRLGEGEARQLALARALYLEQDFVACLNLLVGQDSDGAQALLKLAEAGWLAQVAWPGRVVATLAVDLDQDTDRELLRLTAPGLGEPGLKLDVLSRRRRVYGPVELELRSRDGKVWKKPEPATAVLDARVERVTEHNDALVFLKLESGKYALDLVTTAPDKTLLRYRFPSDRPVTVKDGKISTSNGDWVYQDDRFTRP